MYVMPAPPAHLGSLGLMMPRPNQAVVRGVYYAPHHSTTRTLYQMSGLGDVTDSSLSVNPLYLGLGVAALLGAFYLIGGRKGGSRGRKIARLSSRREALGMQLKALGA